MSQPIPQHLNEQETLDLRAYMRPLWRWKLVIILVAAVAAGGTYFLSSLQHNQYVSSARVYVTVADPAGAVESVQPPASPSAQNMQDLATLFTAQAITTAVYQQLGLPVGSAGSVTAAPLQGSASTPTSFLVVTATSGSATRAAQLVNTYVAVFLSSRRSAQAARASMDAAGDLRALHTLTRDPANQPERQTLLTQYASLQALAHNPSAGAVPISTAVPASAPSSPKPTRNAILGGIVGLLLGIGIVFGLELLDRRVMRVSTVESIYNIPVLAVLPHTRRPTQIVAGRAVISPAFVEAIRSLRVNVRMGSGGRPVRTLLVTSGVPGEGKSTVARDLALVHAEAGESVLIIDADMRRPTLAKLFGVEPEVGLAQVLRGEVAPVAAISTVHRLQARSAGENGSNGTVPEGHPRSRGSIDLLGYGERIANPEVLLSSPAMRDVLTAAVKEYDITIIDSAPLLAVADTVPLLGMVDAVLLVARLGLTTRDSADRVATLIQRVPKTNLVGVVTNDMRDGFADEGYSTYGSYGYGSHGATTGNH